MLTEIRAVRYSIQVWWEFSGRSLRWGRIMKTSAEEHFSESKDLRAWRKQEDIPVKQFQKRLRILRKI